MKCGRIISLTLVLALMLTVPALAADLVAGPVPVYLEDGMAVRASDGMSPYDEDVDALIYSDDDILICQREDYLVLVRADGFSRELGLLSCGAVWCEKDKCVYYVRASAPSTLMKVSADSAAVSTACRAVGPIEHLRISVNGLLAQVYDDEYLFIPVLRKLAGPDASCQGQDLVVRGDYEARLDDQGLLTLRDQSGSDPVEVSPSVMCVAIGDGVLCYLQAWGANARLMVYDIDSGTTRRLNRFDEPMFGQIAVLENDVYVLSKAGALYGCDIDTSEVTRVKKWSRRDFEPRMASVEGLMALYDTSSDSPALLWVETRDIYVPKPRYTPTPRPWRTPTPRPRPTPTPNPYPTLSRGARGDAVVRLQEKLRDLGYLSGSADGVYGTATETAVMYLQFDMGYSQTGTADASFQREVLHGDPPSFATYVTLERGDSGIRVRDLQQRLREQFYTKNDVDGYYGTDTTAAVKRFQAQMGYKEHGATITVSQQRALFKSSAKTCTEYFTLERGDEAPVVKHLNKRLRKLGYLSASATESYNRNTERAVTAFQLMAGLNDTGVADPRTQRMLHENSAPTPVPTPSPTPTPVPTPKPDNKQAVNNSVIKNMRTWMKNNLGENYSKEEAVEQLQVQLAALGYFSTSDINGVYNEKTVIAVESFQVDNGLKVNGNANKQTLNAMF